MAQNAETIGQRIAQFTNTNNALLQSNKSKTGKKMNIIDVAKFMVENGALSQADFDTWLNGTFTSQQIQQFKSGQSIWLLSDFGKTQDYVDEMSPLSIGNLLGFEKTTNEKTGKTKVKSKPVTRQKFSVSEETKKQSFMDHIKSLPTPQATYTELMRSIEFDKLDNEGKMEMLLKISGEKFNEAKKKGDKQAMKDYLLEGLGTAIQLACKKIDDAVYITQFKEWAKERSGLNFLVDLVDKLVDDGDDAALSFMEKNWEGIKGFGDALDGFIGSQAVGFVAVLELLGIGAAALSTVTGIESIGTVFTALTKGYFLYDGGKMMTNGMVGYYTAKTKQEARTAGQEFGLGSFIFFNTLKSVAGDIKAYRETHKSSGSTDLSEVNKTLLEEHLPTITDNAQATADLTFLQQNGVKIVKFSPETGFELDVNGKNISVPIKGNVPFEKGLSALTKEIRENINPKETSVKAKSVKNPKEQSKTSNLPQEKAQETTSLTLSQRVDYGKLLLKLKMNKIPSDVAEIAKGIFKYCKQNDKYVFDEDLVQLANYLKSDKKMLDFVKNLQKEEGLTPHKIYQIVQRQRDIANPKYIDILVDLYKNSDAAFVEKYSETIITRLRSPMSENLYQFLKTVVNDKNTNPKVLQLLTNDVIWADTPGFPLHDYYRSYWQLNDIMAELPKEYEPFLSGAKERLAGYIERKVDQKLNTMEISRLDEILQEIEYCLGKNKMISRDDYLKLKQEVIKPTPETYQKIKSILETIKNLEKPVTIEIEVKKTKSRTRLTAPKVQSTAGKTDFEIYVGIKSKSGAKIYENPDGNKVVIMKDPKSIIYQRYNIYEFDRNGSLIRETNSSELTLDIIPKNIKELYSAMENGFISGDTYIKPDGSKIVCIRRQQVNVYKEDGSGGNPVTVVETSTTIREQMVHRYDVYEFDSEGNFKGISTNSKKSSVTQNSNDIESRYSDYMGQKPIRSGYKHKTYSQEGAELALDGSFVKNLSDIYRIMNQLQIGGKEFSTSDGGKVILTESGKISRYNVYEFDSKGNCKGIRKELTQKRIKSVLPEYSPEKLQQCEGYKPATKEKVKKISTIEKLKEKYDVMTGKRRQIYIPGKTPIETYINQVRIRSLSDLYSKMESDGTQGYVYIKEDGSRVVRIEQDGKNNCYMFNKDGDFVGESNDITMGRFMSQYDDYFKITPRICGKQ